MPTVDIIGGEWVAISVVFTKALPTRCVVLKESIHQLLLKHLVYHWKSRVLGILQEFLLQNEPYRLTWLGPLKCQKYSATVHKYSTKYSYRKELNFYEVVNKPLSPQ